MANIAALARKAQRKVAMCRPKAVAMPARPTKATVARIKKRMKQSETRCKAALRDAKGELEKLRSAAADAMREVEKAEAAYMRKDQQIVEVENVNARRLGVASSAVAEKNERARLEKARIAAGGLKRGRKKARKAPVRTKPVDWSKLREEYRGGVIPKGDPSKGPVKVKKAPAKKRAKKTGKA